MSGLLACLMGLIVVVAGMAFLLRDPYNLEEYAARGAAAGAPSMAAYFAYDTLAGSLGHLLPLGIVAGVLLGALGAGLGLAARRLRRPRSPGP